MPQHALVVDDDLEMCKLIQAILHSTDTEALISVDSEHAVELLHNQKFDSVFLDVNMPPPDGIELTRLIRASGPNQKTPVIIEPERKTRLWPLADFRRGPHSSYSNQSIESVY